MKVKELIRHFSSMEEVPVEIQEDIVPVVTSSFDKIEIYFWYEDIDSEILRGKINHWQYESDGVVHNVIDIYYSSRMPKDWQRLVCCKELVHILDPVDCRVFTETDFDKLCEKIVLPVDLQDPLNDGIPVWSDRFAVLQAVAILFPWACRQHFLDPYKAKKITDSRIAELVDIPIRYVKLVMSDAWAVLHQHLAD